MASKKDSEATLPSIQRPELPTAQEVLARRPDPPRIFQSGVSVKDDYLATQHSVLRFEGTEPLRQAVNEYRIRPDMGDSKKTNVYTNVYIQGYLFSRRGAACRLCFDTERSQTKIVWPSSKRLITGTLVALSPATDNFKTKCLLATVACRAIDGGLHPGPGEAPTTPPRIHIFWADQSDAVIDPTLEMVMIEANGGFFEAVRHAMSGLRAASTESTALDKYILGECTDDVMPGYLEEIAASGDKLKMRAGDSEVEISPGGHIPTSVVGQSPFDASQLKAIGKVISTELIIIQGPPGTGKTFTSVSALQMLTENFPASRNSSHGPIIVAAQSNFATDQLLRRCDAAGIRIARVGGRSRDERVKECSVWHLRKETDMGNALRWRQSKEIRNLEREARDVLFQAFINLLNPDEFLNAGLITEEQRESLGDPFGEGRRTINKSLIYDEATEGEIAKWLQKDLITPSTFKYTTPDNQVEAPALDRDEQIAEPDEALHGEWLPINLMWTGRVDSYFERNWTRQAACAVKKERDLYDIKANQRGLVFKYLQEQLLEIRATAFRKVLAKYHECTKGMVEDKAHADAAMVRRERIQVLGCTTTGLSKYRKFLTACNPRVLLIEEAAETWEANITAALFPSLQQLVLVGDHVQLTPRCHMAELNQDPFNFNVSLFERLVRRGVPYTSLACQRRMIPELRKNFDMWYRNLTDHESVSSLLPVPGMATNSWWFTHSFEDESNAQGSRVNKDEAYMIIGLYKYLLWNEVAASKITILTFYRGQQAMLLEKMRKDPQIRAHTAGQSINVRTVDGFQGEENDVIILSLVRSKKWNRDANAGFLNQSNRMVVSLSRARRGLYIFGDSANLLGDRTAVNIWEGPIDRFRRLDRIDQSLAFVCAKHGHKTVIHEPKDWDKTDGGCQKPCKGQACDAGHTCKRKCHPGDCDKVPCNEPCKKRLRCGHLCNKTCGEDCICETCARIQNRSNALNEGFVPLGQRLQAYQQTREAWAAEVIAEDANNIVEPASKQTPKIVDIFRERVPKPLFSNSPAAEPAAVVPSTTVVEPTATIQPAVAGPFDMSADLIDFGPDDAEPPVEQEVQPEVDPIEQERLQVEQGLDRFRLDDSDGLGWDEISSPKGATLPRGDLFAEAPTEVKLIEF